MRHDSPLRVVSVCSGVGGLDLGLDLAGLQTVALCEFDGWRRRVLRQHWPDVPIFDDLTELDPADLPEFDVLVGGTPCQDLSSAGKRAGLGGLRSSLFWHFMRIRNARGPRWTVWENVDGARTSNYGEDFAAVLGAFVGADVPLPRRREPGLDGAGVVGQRLEPITRAGVAVGPWGGCAWRVLNAQHFGVPQRRRRVFVVGRLGAPCPPEVLIERNGGRGHHPQGARPGTLSAGAPHVRAGVARRGDDGGHRGAAGAAGAGGAADGAGAGGGGAAARPGGGDVVGAITSHLGRGGADDNAARGGHVVGALDTRHQTLGQSGRDEIALAVIEEQLGREDVAPALTTVLGRSGGLGHGGGDELLFAANPADRVPREREVGRAAGGRAGADGDEGRGAGGEAGGVREEVVDARSGEGGRDVDGRPGPPVPAGDGPPDDAAGDGVRPAGAPDPEADAYRVREADELAGRVVLAGGLEDARPGGGGALGLAEGEGATPEVSGPEAMAIRGREGGARPELSDQSPALRAGQGGGSRTYLVPRDGVERTVFSAQFHPEVADDAAASTLDKASRPPLLHEGIDVYNQASTGDKSATLSKSPNTLVRLDAETGAEERCEVGEACAYDPSPDSRRYAACGDGVVSTVAEWIGRRLAAVDRGEDPDG